MSAAEPSEAYLEELRDKADFVLKTGIAPSEYDAMTDLERAVFTEVHNELTAKR